MSEPYLPSNGSEGAGFFENWCCHCARDKAMREGVDFDECDDNEVCGIIAAAFRGPVAEWIYKNGEPTCTAYVPAGETPAQRCERTEDMFR